MKAHSSDFIFSLVDKYNISLDPQKLAEFSDESFSGFCKEYIELSKIRDTQLQKYLISTPNLFRTFLPWRPYIFDSVFQIQWYYDELVMYDPIYFEINYFNTDNIEENKSNLRGVLGFLNTLKDSIKEGFILFGSYDSFATNDKAIEENKFESLLSLPDVREECDKMVQVFKMDNTDSLRRDYYNVRTYYRNKQTMFAVVDKPEKLQTELGYGVWFDLVGSKYTRLDLDEINKLGIYERVYGGIKEDYPIEIKEILGYIDIGAKIKTPMLFNRKLDEIVLKNISNTDEIVKSKANDYYKLFLPFVNGIPSQRLLEVRRHIPSAFTDFRSLLFEIIYDPEKNQIDSDVLQLKIEQKINPILKNLEAEMNNTLTKSRIMGLGLPLVSGLGALGLWHYGVDFSKLGSILLGGVSVSAEFSALSDFIQNKRKEKNSPVYYLWKAQQK